MDARFSPRSAQFDEAFAQTLHDLMFEPQSSYNPTEPGEGQPALQQAIGLPQAPNQQSFSSPVNNTSFNPDYSFGENNDHSTQNPGPFGQPYNPSNFWQDHNASADGMDGTFPNMNDMHQIVQDRRSVTQQFGQITPPNDAVGQFAPRPTPAETAVTEAAEKASRDKSERARNAANQRHAKTKKMGKDSQPRNPEDSKDEEKENSDKKENYRKKNRLAAAKCRAKKKENTEEIEVKHRKLSAMHSSLKKQMQDLHSELTGLRTLALNHQDCNCQVARYNIDQAKRVAIGVEDPSPNMGFCGIGPSLSYLQSPPGMKAMSPQLNSLASLSNSAFASLTTTNDMEGMQNQE